MEGKKLKEILCKGSPEEEWDEENDGFRQIEKVLAPFVRTLKKRKYEKANVLPAAYEELYMKQNPKELISYLHKAFADPVEYKTLLNETAELLKVVTKSKSVNLYLTDYDRGVMVLCPKNYERNIRMQRKYPIGTYLAPYVAFTKEYVISSDILGDVRFPLGIPEVAVVKSVICLPIITNVYENCIGVIELYRECSERPYEIVHLQICNALTAWMGIAMEQNSEKLEIIKERKIQNELSSLAEMYFSGVVPFKKVVADILGVLKAAVKAERGSFYVFNEPVPVDSEDILIADAYEEGEMLDEEGELYEKSCGARFVKNEPGIPGYAARTGEVVNLFDAYKDSRFDRKADSVFYKTRSLVAFPIKNQNGVLAVLKLVNSLEAPIFREEDIELIESFLCHISLICEFYFLSCTSLNRQLKLVLAERRLDFHNKPSADDVSELKNFLQTSDMQFPSGFLRFDWDLAGYEDDLVRFSAQIFMSSDILEQCFEIQKLVEFLLRVKKAYRPLFYHNFEHAFLVLHFAYNIIWRNRTFFRVSETVAILLAALCHDIDHSGMTNTFLSLQNDTTYKLYGETCGEAHRYDMIAFLIQESDLLSHFSPQNFKLICDNLKKLVMGFDLEIHFQNRQQLIRLLNASSFNWDKPEHRLLPQNMILICSDYCFAFKSSEVNKKLTAGFYRELHKQGDMEKSMGFIPLPAFDRVKVDMSPENQVILLSVVLAPVVEVLLRLFSDLTALDELLRRTLARYNDMIQSKGQPTWKLEEALIKEKKESKKGPKGLHVTSTISSIKTLNDSV